MHTSLKITLIALVSVGVIASSAAWYFTKDSPDTPRTIDAEKATITQDIEFSGRLQSKQSVDLSFESTGTLTALLAPEGASVTAGQAIAIIDPAISELEVAKARADQASAAEQKNLSLETAQQNLANTQALNDQLLKKSEQAVRDAKTELDQARALHQATYQENGDSAATETIVSTLKTKEAAYHTAQQVLSETRQTNTKSNSVARATVTEADAAYQATIQASRTTAGLASLEAMQAISQLSLSKKTVHTPFDGVVTFHHKAVGETVIAGTAVATVETINTIELVASVTETDATKITTGMSAAVTFDALPQQDQWTATVTYIAPAAKIIEGVPTYEIKLTLDNDDDQRLKPGLTANIIVHAAQKQNVLAVPRRAVITKGSQQFIFILNDDLTIAEQVVSTGLIGTDGKIEITQGLEVGQKVIIDTASLRDQE